MQICIVTGNAALKIGNFSFQISQRAPAGLATIPPCNQAMQTTNITNTCYFLLRIDYGQRKMKLLYLKETPFFAHFSFSNRDQVIDSDLDEQLYHE